MKLLILKKFKNKKICIVLKQNLSEHELKKYFMSEF